MNFAWYDIRLTDHLGRASIAIRIDENSFSAAIDFGMTATAEHRLREYAGGQAAFMLLRESHPSGTLYSLLLAEEDLRALGFTSGKGYNSQRVQPYTDR